MQCLEYPCRFHPLEDVWNSQNLESPEECAEGDKHRTAVVPSSWSWDKLPIKAKHKSWSIEPSTRDRVIFHRVLKEQCETCEAQRSGLDPCPPSGMANASDAKESPRSGFSPLRGMQPGQVSEQTDFKTLAVLSQTSCFLSPDNEKQHNNKNNSYMQFCAAYSADSLCFQFSPVSIDSNSQAIPFMLCIVMFMQSRIFLNVHHIK